MRDEMIVKGLVIRLIIMAAGFAGVIYVLVDGNDEKAVRCMFIIVTTGFVALAHYLLSGAVLNGKSFSNNYRWLFRSSPVVKEMAELNKRFRRYMTVHADDDILEAYKLEYRSLLTRANGYEKELLEAMHMRIGI